MLIIHNAELRKKIKTGSHYTLKDIQNISTFLEKKGTFNFSPLENGLFPAARVNKKSEYTGYANVWVRDNIHVAHAHYAIGSIEAAIKNVNTLMTYFKKYQKRFANIIKSGKAPKNIMRRPHIRFNGNNIEENSEKWAHAQNDALGYFLWFYCLLLNHEILETKQEDIDMLALFVLYFNAIEYWRDEDSGHWEETRKVNASSIGAVVAGLKKFQQVLLKKNLDYKYKNINVGQLLEELIKKGQEALKQILPNECIEKDPAKKRACDGALLFLVYPLNVVNENMADIILRNIEENLLGDYGIRRYIGDSFWAPDYKKKVSKEKRTSYQGIDISKRDTLLKEKGKEAQWCIFDPIISVIYGKRFQKTSQENYLNKQIYFLNRSLGQITEKFECPELYYIEDSKYVHGDVVPLLWEQANLRIALKMMELST